jgi:small subunit ribosomal protein S2
MTVKVSAEELLEAGAHFGHQAKRWNPKMDPFLYGVEKGVHVFDLMQTKKALEVALEFLQDSVKEGKVILFVGCKKQAKEKTQEVAEACDCPYVNERWLGGTISNFDQIKRSIQKLGELKEGLASGKYADYTKKERLLLEREKERLARFFGGIAGLTQKPDVLVVIDTHKEDGAVREAQMAGAKIVGIVDSNADPDIDFPIPMNDDATKAIEYVLELMKKAIQEGKKSIKSKTGKAK